MLSDLQKRLRAAQLYAIIDTAYLEQKDVTYFAHELVKGGVDIIQLRAKQESLDQIETMAKAIHQITQKAQIPFILNDYVELAAKLGVEGLHVGQEDMPLKEVKRLMPSQTLIGKSTHSLKQALATQEEHPDYIGFGPLFATQTKPTYVPIGLNSIPEVHQKVSLPIFCIGGIKLNNVETVLQAGAKRVVVVSGIMQASSPRQECLKFKQYFN
jgi:thiamine-phosphate pyrophosphorylase